MFCVCYDHQTEEKAFISLPLPNGFAAQVVDGSGFVRALSVLFQVCQLHAMRGATVVCYLTVQTLSVGCVISRTFVGLAITGSNQAYRAISTSQLKALLLLHLWPIDVVVFHGSQGRPCFEGGFPLRCLQRLSCPNIATQHYRWHDNWSTSGSFTPVLSY